MKKVAVLCADEIRDGLLMMVASHRIHQEGHLVTTYHDRLQELASWFAPHQLKRYPCHEELYNTFSAYDMIILQHNNSDRSKRLKQWHKEGRIGPLSTFYPLYKRQLDPPLEELDRVFDTKCSMVENISLAISSLLKICYHSKNNGLSPPQEYQHRHYHHRVLIDPHALSHDQFIALSSAISHFGFDTMILPMNQSLNRSAQMIYESGYFVGIESDLTHLASNLHVPTLLITSRRTLRLWSPGWLKSAVVAQPRYLPHSLVKRLQTKRIVKTFKRLVSE